MPRSTCLGRRPRPGKCDDAGDGRIGWELALLVDFHSGSGAGSFTSTDIIEDAGPASCRFVVAGNTLEGVLELEGIAGRLQFDTTWTVTFRSALAADVEGSFVIADADKRYAGLAGSGRIRGRLVYDSPEQSFLLNATCQLMTYRRVATTSR